MIVKLSLLINFFKQINFTYLKIFTLCSRMFVYNFNFVFSERLILQLCSCRDSNKRLSTWVQITRTQIPTLGFNLANWIPSQDE